MNLNLKLFKHTNKKMVVLQATSDTKKSLENHDFTLWTRGGLRSLNLLATSKKIIQSLHLLNFPRRSLQTAHVVLFQARPTRTQNPRRRRANTHLHHSQADTIRPLCGDGGSDTIPALSRGGMETYWNRRQIVVFTRASAEEFNIDLVVGSTSVAKAVAIE